MKGIASAGSFIKAESKKLSCFRDFLTNPSLWQADFITESAWVEHIPFAFWMIDSFRPKTFVELGAHHGVSYFSFCQAIQELKIPAKAYAIDIWEGDAHSGFYGEEVFKGMCEHNKKYAAFSSMLKTKFDDALPYFEDKSIDLLHIDGYHTYEAVKHDFDAWYPKLSDNAIVLFHDTNIKEREFGVFLFWAEQLKKFRGFEFFHGCGLGVLGIGENYPDTLTYLFESNDQGAGFEIRDFFSRLGLLFKYQQENERNKDHFSHLEKIISEKNNHINQLLQLEGAIVEKDGHVNHLQEQLKQKDILIRETSEKYDDLATQHSNLKTQVEVLNKQITSSDQVAESRQREIDQLVESNSTILGILKINQEQISDLGIIKAELSQKNELLKAKDSELNNLRNGEIPRLRGEVMDLLAVIEKLKTATLEKEKSYKTVHFSLESELAELKRQLQKREGEIKSLQSNSETIIAELELKSRGQQLYHQSLLALFESLSERVNDFARVRELDKSETITDTHLPEEVVNAFKGIHDLFNRVVLENRNIKKEIEVIREKEHGMENSIKELKKTIIGNELEKNRIQDQLMEMQSGVSWRITSPIRYVRKMIPGISRIVGAPFRKKNRLEVSDEAKTRIRLKSIPEQSSLIRKYKLFNEKWYTERYPDVLNFKEGPLTHFLLHGAFEDRSPHPLFDLRWYRSFYKIDDSMNPLLHFIEHSNTIQFYPNAFLNLEWYAEDVLYDGNANAIDIFNHYYEIGEKSQSKPSENFDPLFYASKYPQVTKYKFGILAHYLNEGRINGFTPFQFNNSLVHPFCQALHKINIDKIELHHPLNQYFNSVNEIEEFFKYCQCLPEDITLRFNPHSYVKYNLDLRSLGSNEIEILKHFLLHGKWENRVYRDADIDENTSNFYRKWNLVPAVVNSYQPKAKVCVLVHIFYMDLYEELYGYLKNLSPVNYQIYFNLVENNWTPDIQMTIQNDFPGARIIISKNIGRDIGGFFNLLSYIQNIREYDSFILVHSKKSPHIAEELSTKWRKDLLNSIIGTKEVTLQNVYLFDNLKNIGIIGSELWRHKSVDKNSEKYYRMLDLLEIKESNRNCDYLSGTMLWINAKVIDYLYAKCKEIEFEDGNNKPLEYHMDGQWAHTVERVLGNICKQMALKMIFR